MTQRRKHSLFYSSMLRWLPLVFLGFFFRVEYAQAQMSTQYLTSPQMLAMGNAGLAWVTDEYSLFYNPAGLARNERTRFYPFTGMLGSTDQIYSLVQTLGGFSSSAIASSLASLAGKKVYFETYTLPFFQMPYFAASALFRIKSDARIHNPAFPNMSYSIFTEYGVMGGFGAPLIPKILYVGGSVKYVVRSNSVTFNDMSPSDIFEIINNSSFTSQLREGSGYAASLGVQVEVPTGIPTFKPTLGLSWEDIGTLVFRAAPTSPGAPERVDQSVNVGMSLQYKLPVVDILFAFDIRRLLHDDVSYPQKLHYGMMFKLPTTSFMFGINAGWICGGVTFNLPIMQIDLLTYEEELGNFAGAAGDRRYMLNLKMGFDFEGFSFGKFAKRPR